MGTIANVQADVVQLLSSRTTVAVAFGQIGKSLRAITGIALSASTVSRAPIRRDAAIQQPLQKLTITIGGISRDRGWLFSLALSEAGDHVLCGDGSPDSSAPPSPVRPRSHSCCRSTRAVPVCRLWWHKWNRDPWSTPALADAPALPPGFALPVPADTGASCDGPVPLGGANQPGRLGERSRTMIIIGCDYHLGFQQIANHAAPETVGVTEVAAALRMRISAPLRSNETSSMS